MRVETVTGKSMSEVKWKIKSRYGDNAIIIHQSTKRRWPFSLFHPKVEVTVGIDDSTSKNDENTFSPAEIRRKNEQLKKRLQQQLEEQNEAAERFRRQIMELAKQAPDEMDSLPMSSQRHALNAYQASNTASRTEGDVQGTHGTPLAGTYAVGGLHPDHEELLRKVQEELEKRLGSKLDQIITEVRHNQGLKSYDEPFGTIYRHMLACDFDWTMAQSIVERILRDRPELRGASLEEAWAATEEVIGHLIGTASPASVKPGELRVIAFLGPTGVGKTTTIAKLAADFKMNKQLKVGLITADTYRIAAVEQLRTYAKIIDVPLEVVRSGEEARTAVQKMRHMDVILIDTAGRSPRNRGQMQELKELLEWTRPDESYLVLSATTRPREMFETYQRFKVVKPNKLIFTKLDEGTAFGGVATLVAKSSLPIGYITTGQQVPDDIEIPDTATLVSHILGKVQVEPV